MDTTKADKAEENMNKSVTDSNINRDVTSVTMPTPSVSKLDMGEDGGPSTMIVNISRTLNNIKSCDILYLSVCVKEYIPDFFKRHSFNKTPISMMMGTGGRG